MLLASLLGLWMLAAASGAWADFTGRVMSVTDGDTITVREGSRQVRVRLNGVDAPEKRQAFGRRAKQLTAELVFGQTVTVREHGQDPYGRVIGDVGLPDGRILNEELVRAGLAWWSCRYSRDTHLAELEREARAARRGLWADSSPIPPWDFRRPGRPPSPPCSSMSVP
ncbi:thermonuclease family protein [Nitrospira sp. Kam-Ns4a]